jgi:hypothetical protein
MSAIQASNWSRSVIISRNFPLTPLGNVLYMKGLKTENFNSQCLNGLSYVNIAMFSSLDTAVDKRVLGKIKSKTAIYR